MTIRLLLVGLLATLTMSYAQVTEPFKLGGNSLTNKKATGFKYRKFTFTLPDNYRQTYQICSARYVEISRTGQDATSITGIRESQVDVYAAIQRGRVAFEVWVTAAPKEKFSSSCPTYVQQLVAARDGGGNMCYCVANDGNGIAVGKMDAGSCTQLCKMAYGLARRGVLR